MLSGGEEFVLLGDVAEPLRNNCLQSFAESVEEGNRAPHLWFPVVRLRQLAKGYCRCIPEALWVVAVMQTRGEEFAQALLHFLKEESENAVGDAVRAWCFVLCRFQNCLPELSRCDVGVSLQWLRVAVVLYVRQVCGQGIRKKESL